MRHRGESRSGRVTAYADGAMATARRSRHVPGSRPRSSAVAWSFSLSLAIVLAGCATGERPTFENGPTQTLTGRVEIDAVLTRLDATPLDRFTADYDILTRLGNRESSATVVQAEDSRRSITINTTRYLFDGATVATCDLESGECEAQINPQRTYGELFVDQDFYAMNPAIRLRSDAKIRIGDPVGFEITQGGQQALCVDVPVTGGTKRYCALESGPLALYDGNDLNVALTSYTSMPDEAKFETS